MDTILSGVGREISSTEFAFHFAEAVRSDCFNLYPNGFGWLCGINHERHSQCWFEIAEDDSKVFYADLN